MNILSRIANPARSLLDAMKVHVHLLVLQWRFPSLSVQRPCVWRYDALRAVKIGEGVSVGPLCEILVLSSTIKSTVIGQLILRDRVALGSGCNLRAAGGTIDIGAHTLVGQQVHLIAANHLTGRGVIYRDLGWDEKKTGVKIGTNCWLGAGCIVLPGVEIGDNSVIGAGSVVTKSVPSNQIWAGVPARFLRNIT